MSRRVGQSLWIAKDSWRTDIMTRNYRESLDQFQLIRACLIFLAVVSLSTESRSARAAAIEVTAVDGETMAEAEAFTILFGGEEFDNENMSDTASSFADFPLIAEAGANTSQAGANAGARLNASMTDSGINAEGSADALAQAAFPNSARAFGEADLSVTFTLDRRLGYQLDWGFAVFAENNIGMGSISLRSPDAVIFSAASPGIPGAGGGVQVGVLEAGEYVLRGSMVASADAPGMAEHVSASGSFFFEFSVVPEPGSAALAAMAAATLSASLRRKRRRERGLRSGLVINRET
jgi:hypothetical protein